MQLHFTKMHGCGNDYVYVNCFEETVDLYRSIEERVEDAVHFQR